MLSAPFCVEGLTSLQRMQSVYSDSNQQWKPPDKLLVWKHLGLVWTNKNHERQFESKLIIITIITIIKHKILLNKNQTVPVLYFKIWNYIFVSYMKWATILTREVIMYLLGSHYFPWQLIFLYFVWCFRELFNVKAIFVKEQQWYYSNYSLSIKRVHTFFKSIYLKVNVM